MKSLVQRIIEFMNTRSLEEKQLLAQQNSIEFLSPDIDEIFDELKQANAGDSNLVEIIEEHKAFLVACREHGIEAVFSSLSVRSELTNVPEALGNILNELEKPEQLADIAQRITLCQTAIKLVSRQGQPQLWASLNGELASSLAQSQQGSRTDNLEQAIDHYDQILAVYTHERFPEEWAATHYNLGITYRDRIKGKRADNLELAIDHYNQALEVRTHERFPEEWAMTHNNLGNAYGNRIRGERTDNLELAIEHYNLTLMVRTREAFPEEWAIAHNNLGNAYSKRIQGKRADNLEQAINHYSQAMTVRTREAFPKSWASIHNALGVIYRERVRGKRADNLEQAINHYSQSLIIYTSAAFPNEWAAINNDLGIAFNNRIHGVRANNLEKAIDHYTQALMVYIREAFPEGWALTQSNLGTVYIDRIRGERADNLEQAIDHFTQALTIRTREDFPESWAMTRNNLGNAYSERIKGERTDNLEKAINHYTQSLTVYTCEAFPEGWAMAHNNLGKVYTFLVKGERADNFEKAISHYTQALTVYTREEFPENWATIHSNIGAVYDRRIRGKRADNVEQAIYHANQSLAVRTREAFPEDWASTHLNLGTDYFYRVLGERTNNLEQSIEHYNLALSVFTHDAFPNNWALVHSNLGNTYSYRIQGNHADNVEQAIKHYSLALSVRTRKALKDHRHTQRNLGRLYFESQRWALAETAYSAAIEAGSDLLTEAYTLVGRQAAVAETSEMFSRSTWCLLQSGQNEEALMRLEQGKTRLLNETLSLDDVKMTQLSSEDQTRVQATRQQLRIIEAKHLQAIGESGQNNDTLRQARKKLHDEMCRTRNLYPDFLSEGLSLKRLLALIPVGGALIAPVFTSVGSAVFVVPYGATKVTSTDVISLAITTHDLQKWLWDGDNKEGWLEATLTGKCISQALDRLCPMLWNQLVAPIHEHLVRIGLKPGAPIMIMPQGSTGLLPWHAAWRRIDGKCRYFADDYTVTYISSGQLLEASQKRLQTRQDTKRSLLAVINPTKDLPWTRDEGKAISSLFDKDHSDYLDEDKATLAAVLSATPGKGYLHFACHGFYNWSNPLDSGLALAGNSLTLAEIMTQMDLSHTHLVTLAACQTGITDVSHSPDEAVGLSTGFFQAGATAVVSSLWPVNDRASGLLMQRFYQGLLNEKKPPAQALADAQTWIRTRSRSDAIKELGMKDIEDESQRMVDKKSYGAPPIPDDHPYYWAGFVYSGP